MSFTVREATGGDVKIIGGLAGPSGGGKTLTALLLARGIVGPNGRIVTIDTEHGRSQIYARDSRVAPWYWMDFQPPFSPERYVEAFQAAEATNPDIIIVDSISHEHEGEGGLLEIQEEYLEKRAGDNAAKRDALSMPAWSAAKARHKKLLLHLIRMPCHVLVCMRAQDKIELVKNAKGKLEAVPKRTMRGAGLDGWVPICEKRMPFEMTFSFMFLPDRPGFPRPLKPMPDTMASLVSLDRPMGVDTGERLAQWSREENGSPTEKTDAPKLTSELLDLAHRLGKRDDVATAIANHRHDHSADMPAHVRWLRDQIKRAKAKVSENANAPVAL